MLPRKFALPLSLALTALVGFVLTSFASDAGWLSEAAEPAPVAVALDPTASPTLSPTAESILAAPIPPAATVAEPEVVVVTDYVYEDVPVYREVPAAVVESSPTPISIGRSKTFSTGTSPDNRAAVESPPSNEPAAPSTSNQAAPAPSPEQSAAVAPSSSGRSIGFSGASSTAGGGGASAAPSSQGEPEVEHEEEHEQEDEHEDEPEEHEDEHEQEDEHEEEDD